MATTTRRFPKAAVFVDAENHADLDVSALMRQLRQFDVVERHAYADWRNQCLDHLSKRLNRRGFRMHHVWSGPRPGARKDTADSHMARGIAEVLSRRPEIEVVVIVSGDAFFAGVARQLREQGKQVVVASAPLRTSKELRSVADEYLLLGRLERSIWALDRLERASKYVTFRFAVRELGIRPFDLAELVRKGLVMQKEVSHPERGTRPEIYLNREAYAVQTVLGIAA
ncbi:MAG TPA: NYN domain-containing protein [Thermoflexia bacterium]|nr:NYN domain-containing protein [Thermoflexia bacterium]